MLWTDEKLFTVEMAYNVQNDRVLAKGRKGIPYNKLRALGRQGVASVMVRAGVTSDGRKTPLSFIEEGVKVDQAVYLNLLSEEVMPWVKNEYGEAPILFQQDGAPSDTAKVVQAFCRDQFAAFWAKEEWPPSSPYVNPMDFSIIVHS